MNAPTSYGRNIRHSKAKESVPKYPSSMRTFWRIWIACTGTCAIEDGEQVFIALKQITEDMNHLLDAKKDEKDQLEQDDLIDEE